MSKKKHNSKSTKNTKARKKQKRALYTKKEWLKIFEELCVDSEIELELDEKIKQCKSPYPKYWFITSSGRLYSIWNKRIEQKDVEILPDTGTNRDQLVWRYTYGDNHHVTVHCSQVSGHVL